MKPLEGIRVLDLSRLLPGPFCAMLLADLGADVIKIESPGLGDYLRAIFPFVTNPRTGEKVGAHYLMVNRNKKSVALNFRNARGKELFLQLARHADVIIETFRPGAAARWGIGYEAIRSINPGIVYCSLSGYGQTGPYRDRAGHDLNYIAQTGLLAANGRASDPPVPPAAQIADLSGAMYAAVSILAALIGRTKTGAGEYLDVSLFDSGLAWTGTIIGGTLAAGGKIERGRNQLNGGMACYNVYETSDGKYITVAAIEPHFWVAFCKAVAHEGWIPRQYDFDPISEVAEMFKRRPLDEWLSLFQEIDACIEPVHDFQEALEHPQVKHRGLAVNIGGIPQIGSVFVFAKNDYAPAPSQGEHTFEVLRTIGISDEEMRELEKRGVIKGRDRQGETL
jgi:crotonobetainyl-CoA:carnitine CoA-transferase CaiB-like acyl-CoA transferase